MQPGNNLPIKTGERLHQERRVVPAGAQCVHVDERTFWERLVLRLIMGVMGTPSTWVKGRGPPVECKWVKSSSLLALCEANY